MFCLDLAEKCVEVHRSPAGESYGERPAYRASESIAVAGSSVAVTDLLP